MDKLILDYISPWQFFHHCRGMDERAEQEDKRTGRVCGTLSLSGSVLLILYLILLLQASKSPKIVRSVISVGEVKN